MSSSIDMLQKVEEARTYFAHGKYSHVVKEATRCFEKGEHGLCLVHLSRLPSDQVLLAQLVESLKGKSVHKTLERAKRNSKDTVQNAIATSSLITHILLEIKQGRLEYKKLLDSALSQINNQVFGVLGKSNEAEV